MSSSVPFIVYSVVAGSAFAYALLWAIAQWLKADKESRAIEEGVRRRADALRAAGCVNPSPGCCRELEEAAT